jgi:hypothetical protein
MEDVIRKELEHQESELASNTNQSSWKRLIGFQRSTIEEKYREQCAKELERVLVGRQQFDRTTKNNYVVCFNRGFDAFNISLLVSFYS